MDVALIEVSCKRSAGMSETRSTARSEKERKKRIVLVVARPVEAKSISLRVGDIRPRNIRYAQSSEQRRPAYGKQHCGHTVTKCRECESARGTTPASDETVSAGSKGSTMTTTPSESESNETGASRAYLRVSVAVWVLAVHQSTGEVA